MERSNTILVEEVESVLQLILLENRAARQAGRAMAANSLSSNSQDAAP